MALDGVTLTRLRLSAAKKRAAWLAGVAAGMVSVDELIRFAATAEGSPLRTIRLHILLTAQPGWGDRRAEAVLARLRMELGVKTPPDRAWAVSFLLDGRSDRSAAWAVALNRPETIFAGFPHEGEPHGAR